MWDAAIIIYVLVEMRRCYACGHCFSLPNMLVGVCATTLPVFCDQAVEEDSHLQLGEICSYTKSHATTKSHEMLRPAIYFHSLYGKFL